MNDESKEFHNITAADELKFVKHNPTDYQSFHKFQAEMDERFSKVEEERTKKEIVANIRKWEAHLPERWRDASLPKIKHQGSRDGARLIKERGKTSMYIQGASGTGKTYLGYAILRRYIGLGVTTPSQIKIVSEELLMSFASTGWEGQKQFSELFKPKYTFYLFDGVGRKENYTEREAQLYEQLIDHIYSKSLVAIFTSNKSAASFAHFLSDSGKSKLSHLVAKSIITLKNELPKPTLDDLGLTEEEKKKVARDRQVENALWDD